MLLYAAGSFAPGEQQPEVFDANSAARCRVRACRSQTEGVCGDVTEGDWILHTHVWRWNE